MSKGTKVKEILLLIRGHSKLSHTAKLIKCRKCSYTSTNRTNFQMHFRTHTDEKPYKCNICDFATAQLANLQGHMRTHTRERIYKCKECSYNGPNMCHFLRHKAAGSKNVLSPKSSSKTPNSMAVSYYWQLPSAKSSCIIRI
ncbi:zinc-finger double domain-containing protein [Ditylenchus destructor]|uniref:Zinc-finger double domain-containing protein n=1 Tax=Ditylenchus destructor TaxID=166010 RepID=A0AAD4MHN7_9BILA|nr:zinc-finger double domain-containing protein [Ditylenchus destructor]